MYPYNQGYDIPGQRSMAGGIDFSEIMRQVYLWLAVGLLVGFGVALGLAQQLTAGNPLVVSAFENPILTIGVIVVYMVVGFAFYPIVYRSSPAIGAVLYLLFTAIFGIMISTIFLVYSTASIWEAFLTAAIMFGVMSVIGFTTRLDLSKLGAILFMALIGIIVASLVNFFLHSGVLMLIVSIISIVVFSGLTAYDTQWIKRQALSMSASASNTDVLHRIALLGAFRLFLDFVNLFLSLLRIFGRNR
ncbi:MAG TPA: Bax inhibitor-1/YccA family protein [Ktedonobacterales bacterium]